MVNTQHEKSFPLNSKKLKLIARFLLAALALFLVFRKLDLEEVKSIILQANYFWFIPALLLVIISKSISAVRMHYLFRCIGLDLGIWYNIKLSFVGLYYNLFLPGGIGGDGYKVYFLNKHKPQSLKSIITATFLDRASGVWAIVFLVLVLFFFVPYQFDFPYFETLLWIGMLLAAPVFYLVLKAFFPVYTSAFIPIAVQSLLVQGTQIICVWTILEAFGTEGNETAYYLLFLLSSFAAVLPITIGGVGAREAVLVILPDLLKIPINTDMGVTMTLTFFLLSLISSVPGAFINLEPIPEPSSSASQKRESQPIKTL